MSGGRQGNQTSYRQYNANELNQIIICHVWILPVLLFNLKNPTSEAHPRTYIRVKNL